MKKFETFILATLLITSLSCIKINSNVNLETRALSYWKIKESGEYTFKKDKNTTSLYFEYLSQKSKSKLTEKDFYSKLTAKVSNISIENLDFNDDSNATVTIKYNLDYKGYILKGIKIKEKWVKENGKWMVVVNPNSNPFWKQKL